MRQSQLLINELQNKLNQQLQTKSTKQNNKKATSISNTLDNIDSYPACCMKCTEEFELKIRHIETLKSEIEQLGKSKDHLKHKLSDYEQKEAELLAQMQKHADLVKHLEIEIKNVSFIFILPY